MCKPCSDVCVNDPTKLWEKGIVPYKFDNMVSSELIHFVNKAMEEITKVSSIKFVERTNQIDYVKIVNKGGYWSYVGKHGGEQVITIFAYNINSYHLFFILYYKGIVSYRGLAPSNR